MAFGGPAAHIAMIEHEVVGRKKWMTREHFLDLLGATNLIPGPNSTEMAIQIGYARAGWRGLLLAGVCFILPAVVLTLLLAHLYAMYGTLPLLVSLIAGIRAAVIAVILAAVARIGKPVLRNRFMLPLGLMVAALSLLGIDAVLLLLASGLLGVIWASRGRLWRMLPFFIAIGFFPFMPASGAPQVGTASSGPPDLIGLGTFFLKVGSILYGSGYVLVAFLRGGLVEGRHWLSEKELLDAVAVGQFTPGPVLSTATFLGYLILGLPGAAVATIGIFLPSFIFVLIIAPLIPRLRSSPLASGFLDGVNAASLGLMAAVCVSLGISTLSGIPSWAIFLMSAVAMMFWEINPGWAILGGALAGWIFSLVHI